MSENQEPKRKRRTKAEIEEAKANGTYKPRARKAPKEVTSTEEAPVAPEQHAVKEVKQELPKEQQVLIMSCLNPRLASAISELAKGNGVKVVILEDRVIKDYIEAEESKNGDDKSKLSAFLNNTSNRLHAEQQAVKLWKIMTFNKPIEDHDLCTFSRTQVVKATNLSHGKAAELFDFLKAFGMLKFTKGTHEFQLIFDKQKIHESMVDDIEASCLVVNANLTRYNASLESDKDLTKEDKDVLKKKVSNLVDSTIEFD